MKLPIAPDVQSLDHISPTLYEAAIKCTSRASWVARGERSSVPAHPRALLGTGVHAVLEHARNGRIGGETPEERRIAAGNFFDERLTALFDAAHPLLRAKFETTEKLPFYYLYRARAAQMAADVLSKQTAPGGSRAGASPKSGAERSLASKDGRIRGRADLLDAVTQSVIDYKTGGPANSSEASEAEQRQLRLYAYLAEENGVTIRRGIIERADRRRVEVPITPAEAQQEGKRALQALDSYNSNAGVSFSEAATPSASNCQFCPCIPFCEAFWKEADLGWAADCGTHIEGVVAAVDGDELISISVDITRGSGPRGEAVVTRLSRHWVIVSGEAPPAPGDLVRVVDASFVEGTSAPSHYRADRTTTSVWQVSR